MAVKLSVRRLTNPASAIAGPEFFECTQGGVTVVCTAEELKDFVLSFLGTAATADIDTDSTFAADSDLVVPSQKAVKTAIANAVVGLLDLKTGTDCSANPNYPAALKGDAYYVTVAGKIGGAAGTSVDVGDVYAASADNAGGTEAAVGASWFHLEHNLLDMLNSPAFTGTPTAPTAAPGTNTTQLATTAFVTAAIALVGSGGTEIRGLTFTSDTGSVADADNTAGFLWWDNATQASATTLFFDNLTADAVATTTFFAALGTTGFIYLQQSDDSTKWQIWKWSAVTAGSGYYKFAVALQASGGSIADNKTVYTEFVGAGTAGAVGSNAMSNVYAARNFI